MALTLEYLNEQKKSCLTKQEEAIQLFHRLTGAVQILDGQIAVLEKEVETEIKTEE